ncbi:CocE/NonD family hydrolase [Microbacterium sp. 18062]|uniref:CocE/NonD family hydrolase n=1 Tax=Microbacterium sp. 18062 TaxID=2681410 RepID=UPI001357EC68|nr:CocE/NonD family hydrolase [Microbacterium sp. 18062]
MTVAGIEPGQRRLNGPQTTGREYRNLSEPAFEMTHDFDVAVPMRDGVELMVDVWRPDTLGEHPVLVSASPYPRQIQDLGAPMGFIEAGASDFFVPRGYVHVIANLRGTGGSGGEFTMFDAQERHDVHDLVEWAAAQEWSDGNVGMIGISYFAMTQLEAAVEQPPHLRAIMPVAVTADLYEAASHHGLANTGFLTPFLAMVGLTAHKTDRLWRGKLLDVARRMLNTPVLHERFGRMNGEAAVVMLKRLMHLHHDPHPWDDLWRDAVVAHPARDEWWDERNLVPQLHKVTVPVYLGCDWENVPLHLPATFGTMQALTSSPEVRVGMLGEFGLTWPWESLHIEALAWYDHWLKGRDTGILDGPRIRYALPGDDEWHTADTWPPASSRLQEWLLAADGSLAPDAAVDGDRTFMTLGAGLNRAVASPTDPPSSLTWTSEPLTTDLDIAGDIELTLDATATASDLAWIAVLMDVAPDGAEQPVTAGYLRASLRAVDEEASEPGAPVLACRTPVAVPLGEQVRYRVPLVPNARRFAAGHRIRLTLIGDDQPDDTPAIMGFRHASVGTSTINTVAATSRLKLPVLDG